MNISMKTAGGLRIRQNRFQRLLNRFKEEKVLHLMILPTVLVTITMAYFPMYGIIIAFKRFDVFKGVFKSPGHPPYGFEHFIDFLNSPSFGHVLTNTILIAFLKLGLLSFPGVIFAMLLNEVKGIHFKKIYPDRFLPTPFHFVGCYRWNGLQYPEPGWTGQFIDVESRTV